LSRLAPAAHAKLLHLPNGIPIPPVITADERNAARNELGLSSGVPTALYLGELEPRKRPLDAVRAVEDSADLVLLVAGRGPLENEIGGGQVRMLGYRTDPSSLFAAADMFVMPSEREGLSFALLEAMSYGLPVIASDGPGNPEAVGDAGLICPVGDVEGLRAAMRRLADHPEEREQFAQAARERAMSKFSLSRFLRDVDEVFADAIRV
jgi:glycosyltransferase involved in cell wall biosynthesis